MITFLTIKVKNGPDNCEPHPTLLHLFVSDRNEITSLPTEIGFLTELEQLHLCEFRYSISLNVSENDYSLYNHTYQWIT